MTEVLLPEKRTRNPFALDWSPARSTRTPAVTSSSLYLAIAARSSSLGILPASLSLFALTIIMNLTVPSPNQFVTESRDCFPGESCSLPLRRTGGGKIDSTKKLNLRQSVHFHEGADLNGAPTAGGDPSGDVDGFIKVFGIN